MVYWSDNHFAFPNLSNILLSQDRLLILPNGIYSIQRKTIGTHDLVGFVHIKNNYTYENQFLENIFVAPFNLPASYKIVSNRDANSYPIFDQKNNYLFSVLPPQSKLYNLNKVQLYYSVLFYVAALIFLLMTIYKVAKGYRKKYFIIEILAVFIILGALYGIHLLLSVPHFIKHLSLFSPQYYAASNLIPTLGDFFFIVVLFFFWSLVFIRIFPKPNRISKIYVMPMYAFVLGLYQVIGFSIQNLIGNSNINYKLNQITGIDQYSIACYLAIAMLLLSGFMIHLKIILRTDQFSRERLFLKINLVCSAIAIILSIYYPGPFTYMMVLFFLVNLLQGQIKKMQISLYSISYSIIFISLFSVISLLLIYQTIKERDIDVQKLYAINLSSEQDATTEVFLRKMQDQFNKDSIIHSLLIPPYKQLESHLNRYYFSGYFRKYDIQYWFCDENDSVLVQPENVSEPCFPFFNQMIKSLGTKISETSFYHMNNMNGRVTYFGKLDFETNWLPNSISVFIEINSKIASEGIGFPELLLDKTLIKPSRYQNLSYGKYFEDELVNRSGDFPYNYYLESYKLKDTISEFQLVHWNDYDHIVYTLDQNNHIIVSNKALKLSDYIISFPYIFVFNFIFVLVIILFGNSNIRRIIVPQDFRFKIQISIISVVLISLLFVASGTIFYNIDEYRQRHQNDLMEKIKSISDEIRNRMLYVNEISPELKVWLYDELYKISNTFRTDINIYDIKGELIATSRPEIYAKGVTTNRMNATAFYELSQNYQLSYFQPEKIGKLSYLSAYEPIMNSKGDYIGYLNLPYFTREDDLKQSISNFIVAFINLYLFLFLASVIVAVLLSNKLTKPLSLIREKLKGIQLGKKSEPINYESKDEIGELVSEYNHKVEELAESAELLARSERESAWREMAKQVAHEIKNPLTPMKLNLQYLQRAKEEGNEQYDAFFNRVTQNLIEQIDTLSEIATEFSNFAQIPKAKNETFDLVLVLKNLFSLFESNQNVKMDMEQNGLKEVFIYADKEQISRVFLNLIKNGIQAIPSEEIGKIAIGVTRENGFAVVSIRDNGLGISQEAQEHLFEPNFTTKTSGMGLGLSIANNIIQSAGGKINYETIAGEGTTFFVHLPTSNKIS